MKREEVIEVLEDAFGECDKKKYHISVTKFVDRFVKPFDKDLIAPISAKKAGVSTEEILELWDLKAEKGRMRGVILHTYLESLFNQEPDVDLGMNDSRYLELCEGDKEFNNSVVEVLHAADKFYEKIAGRYEPIWTEKMVGDDEFGINGKPDLPLFDNNTGNIVLFDAKQGKELTAKGYNKMLGPFSKHKDGNLVTGSLQLSMYKFIIEKNTGLKVSSCILGHFGKVYNSHAIIDLTPEIKLYLDV